MDDLLQNDDLLIRYIDGEMPEPERTVFEQRLTTDASLQERLTQLKVAVQSIRYFGTTQQVGALHTEMMNELRSQPKRNQTPVRRLLVYALSVAAAVIFLVVGIRLYQAAQASPEKIYSQTFVDFAVSSSRGVGLSESRIETYYKQKAYKSIITDVRSTQLDPRDSLLLGLAYLQTNDAAHAVGLFQRIASYENEYRQDAEFYLSLAYLKNGNSAQSLQIMQKIRENPAHLYREQIDEAVISKVKKLQP